jgi:hypothetical protein
VLIPDEPSKRLIVLEMIVSVTGPREGIFMSSGQAERGFGGRRKKFCFFLLKLFIEVITQIS